MSYSPQAFGFLVPTISQPVPGRFPVLPYTAYSEARFASVPQKYVVVVPARVAISCMTSVGRSKDNPVLPLSQGTTFLKLAAVVPAGVMVESLLPRMSPSNFNALATSET